MDLSFNCTCGAQIRVTAVDAGGTKRCRCGQVNTVPSLSKLRQQAGKPSYEVGIADKLRHMFAEDRLPPDNVCVECGSETSDILQCSVECERPRAKGRGYWSTVVLGMLAPFWFLISLSHDYKNAEVFGEDLIVQTPLPLCPTCAAAIQPRKKDLHNLLRRVPLYDQLLQEYPHADADIRQ